MDRFDRNRLIIDLWKDKGQTHGQIVKSLKAQGIASTRSTVSGVLFRARLDEGSDAIPKRPFVASNTPKAKPAKEKYRINAATKPPRLPAPINIPGEPEPIGPIGDIPDKGCQYSKNDIGTYFQMCGHPQRPGSKYCGWHLDNIIRRPDGRTCDGRALKVKLSA